MRGLSCQVLWIRPDLFYLLTIYSKDKETSLLLADSFHLDRHATADRMSIPSVLLMHFQTAAAPLADLSVYDLAHGWVFDLHLSCATCCSWLDGAVLHQRKIHSTLAVAVKTAVRRCAASARVGPRADGALTAVSWRERERQKERVRCGHKDYGFTDPHKQASRKQTVCVL